MWWWRSGCGRGESLWSIEAVCHSSLMLSITESSWKQSPLWRALGKWMHCWLPVTTHNTKAQLFTLGSACGDIILSPGKKKNKKNKMGDQNELKCAWLENAARCTSKMALLDVCGETSHWSLAPLISVSKKQNAVFDRKCNTFCFHLHCRSSSFSPQCCTRHVCQSTDPT